MDSVKIDGNKLIVLIEKTFNLEGDVDLQDTSITALPDGLSVGGSLYKDF